MWQSFFNARPPDPEASLRHARQMRDVQLEGTLPGLHYRLLDNILDQIVLEECQRQLSDALRTQLLQETKIAISGLKTQYIYMTVRLPEALCQALTREGYAIWFSILPLGHAVFFPGGADDTRAESLRDMGYIEWVAQ